MAILKNVQSVFQFVLEGAARIFTPNKDIYPATGLQPFEGEVYDKHDDDN
ncbi:MAG: hypothetical protein WBA57_17170 [Elainellaceae cyanobacterium]